MPAETTDTHGGADRGMRHPSSDHEIHWRCRQRHPSKNSSRFMVVPTEACVIPARTHRDSWRCRQGMRHPSKNPPIFMAVPTEAGVVSIEDPRATI
ncbi:hypothetical protein ACLKA7_000746 [Drosophila subpalustris]